MPEGPEIRRAADRIAAAIAHRPLTEVFFAFEHLKQYEREFRDRTVLKVAPQGKAMLIYLEADWVIYSHNQLYGKWMVRNAHNYPQTKRQLRLALHNERKSALLYSASDIAVLRTEELALHPFLQRLGPDVLSPDTTLQMVRDRFTNPRFRRRKFTTLLLDQQFLAGLGNYLRSEILFVARVHPERHPHDCTEAELDALAAAAIAVPQQSYATGGITNDLDHATQLKAKGVRRSAYRHWVFSRAGKPCWVCGTPIVKALSGGRRYYLCLHCQR